MHCTGNKIKMENGRYTYAIFKKILPLAFNLSGMHGKMPLVSSGNSEFTKERYHLVGLSIMATNLQSFLS